MAVEPIAQAESMRIRYCEWNGADEPLVWDTRLPNECTSCAGYLSANEWVSGEPAGESDWRISAVTNLEFGTYATAVGAGSDALLEIGPGLHQIVSSTSLGAGLGSFVGAGAAPTERPEVSAFVSITGYAVAQYLPLDGTVCLDSHSVEGRSDLFGQVGLGDSICTRIHPQENRSCLAPMHKKRAPPHGCANL